MPYNVYVFFLIFSGLPQTGQPGGARAVLKAAGGRADATKKPGAAKGAKQKPASTKKATSARKARTAKKRK